MKKEQILVAVVALVAGLLLGIMFFSGKKKEEPYPQGVPMGGGSPTDYQRRISEEEQIVLRDPQNVRAWIQLGNDYFDTAQPLKAIDAYGKALAIAPDNPNVLTDQGIMYRKMGWFDKAIANFEKAQTVQPNHLQSLFNMGVVYLEDLKEPKKAVEVWSRYLKVDSTSPTAQQIKAAISQVQGEQPGK